jgi:hypothetical protein
MRSGIAAADDLAEKVERSYKAARA